MASGSPDLGAPSRPSLSTSAAVVVLCFAFAVTVAVAVTVSVSRALALDERRAEAFVVRSEPVTVAGPATAAFRRFRSTLADDSRFALVFGPGVDRNGRGTYRLVAGYYLYPAIRVARPSTADAVMVFGSPTAAVRRSFEEVALVDGIWLGRRR